MTIARKLYVSFFFFHLCPFHPFDVHRADSFSCKVIGLASYLYVCKRK